MRWQVANILEGAPTYRRITTGWTKCGPFLWHGHAMASPWDQDGYRIRFDWGAETARRQATASSILVDVLSFTTTVTVAVERGTAVYPMRSGDAGAGKFAEHPGSGTERGDAGTAVVVVAVVVARRAASGATGAAFPQRCGGRQCGRRYRFMFMVGGCVIA